MPHPAHHRPPRRKAYSLLELVLAIALAGGTLTPALVLMRRGMEVSRSTDQQLLLTNYAIAKLEETLADVAANWTEAVTEGDLAADGFAWLRYTVASSDEVADGGLVDQLMSITATTYVDANSNDTQDPGEPSCTFRTKIANLNSYVEKAGS